jgi:hypothetical protein
VITARIAEPRLLGIRMLAERRCHSTSGAAFSLEYQQTFVLPKDRVPTKVIVFEAAATVDINAT